MNGRLLLVSFILLVTVFVDPGLSFDWIFSSFGRSYGQEWKLYFPEMTKPLPVLIILLMAIRAVRELTSDPIFI
jgi:hypothetical protein